jgi:1-aminocyclopropane-1-carboxylate deaminase/D-cysteine desulfhydrase-like pyridoxal-dependent ACC family enzyme
MELSPVEQHGKVYYKRDDLYMPYGVDGVNGGKVRQAQSILEHYQDHIRENCNGIVMTPTSVHSPQGSNVSMVAKHLGLKTICCIGGPYDETKVNNIIKHPHMKFSILSGGEIKVMCKHGMNNVIFARMKKLSKINKGFVMQFGFVVEENPFIVIDPIADQCQNIPDGLDYLVVPTGSGLHMTGVLYGLHKYKKKVKEVIAVGVGPDRSKSINEKLVSMGVPQLQNKYKFVSLYKDIPYHKHIKETFGDTDEYMDTIYEGKAHRWVRENMDMKKKIGFWSIGRRITDDRIDELTENLDIKGKVSFFEDDIKNTKSDIEDLFE